MPPEPERLNPPQSQPALPAASARRPRGLTARFNRAVRGLIVAGLSVGGALAGTANGPAADHARDRLIFNDGDQVLGHLVKRGNGTIVFASDRFGELRVPSSEARVVVATPIPSPAPSAAAPTEKPAAKSGPASQVVNGRPVASWHGRLAFAVENLNDSAERDSTTVDARLQRTWSQDEVALTGRYVYSRTAGIATTDVAKTEGAWRHNFAPRYFSQYRLLGEWNRAAVYKALPSDYVLVQNEIGAGVNLLRDPDRKLRLGLSENLLDVWAMEPEAGGHSSRLVDGAFVEAEWKLPWRMNLIERAVWYYRAIEQINGLGWENHFELSMKLTEVLSAVLQHETRDNSPDPRVQDFQRLKLLLGLDF